MTQPPTTERLLRLPEVQRRVPLSRSAIYDRIKAGTFPAPVKIGPRASAWHESAIIKWIEERSEAA